jgi:hypothetical protein
MSGIGRILLEPDAFPDSDAFPFSNPNFESDTNSRLNASLCERHQPSGWQFRFG